MSALAPLLRAKRTPESTYPLSIGISVARACLHCGNDVNDPTRTSRRPTLYFVIIRRDAALGVCSAGEITNVTQAFQPSGRFWLANSQ
jgi:hypothetical protein